MEILTIAITAVVTILTSGGLWTYLQYRHNQDNSQTRLIRGIGYTMLINQSTSYIRRGKISRSEFVELHRMLYQPYKELGGNGAAERAFNLVRDLPSTDETVVEQIEREQEEEDEQ